MDKAGAAAQNLDCFPPPGVIQYSCVAKATWNHIDEYMSDFTRSFCCHLRQHIPERRSLMPTGPTSGCEGRSLHGAHVVPVNAALQDRIRRRQTLQCVWTGTASDQHQAGKRVLGQKSVCITSAPGTKGPAHLS